MFDADHKFVLAVVTFGLDEIRVAVVDEAAFVELFEDVVEEADHLNREVDELIVEFAVEVFEVCAMDFEDGTFQ